MVLLQAGRRDAAEDGRSEPAWSRPTVDEFRDFPWAGDGSDPLGAVRA